MWCHTILLTVTLFLQEQTGDGRYIVVLQHLWQLLWRKVALSVPWKTGCIRFYQLTASFSLKVVSSYETMTSYKYLLSPHMCRNKIPSNNLGYVQSLYGAVLTCSFQILSFQIQSTLVLGTPISQKHRFINCLRNCAKVCNTLATPSSLIELWGFPGWSLLSFLCCPLSLNLPVSMLLAALQIHFSISVPQPCSLFSNST